MKKQEADNAAKQAIDMPGMATTRLPYTDWPSRELKSLNGKENGKTILANYTTSNHILKHVKCPP